MTKKRAFVGLLGVMLLNSTSLNHAFAAPITPSTKTEISYLFDYLKKSNCSFNRNGTWYTPSEAVDHLNTKYAYFLKKEKIASTEDFIKLGASESSMSGKAYQVKCGTNTTTSQQWFNSALTQYHLKNQTTAK